MWREEGPRSPGLATTRATNLVAIRASSRNWPASLQEIADGPPCGQLFRERSRVRRRRRRQSERPVAGIAPHRERAGRGLAVEAHELKSRRSATHACGLPVCRIANRAVEAAMPPARDDRVPEADSACAQR